MNLGLLSILNRAPQIVAGKAEDDQADANPLAQAPLVSGFSQQLNQKLNAKMAGAPVKSEPLMAQLMTLAQPAMTVATPIETVAVPFPAMDVPNEQPESLPTDTVLLATRVEEDVIATDVAALLASETEDDVYVNVSTDEVLAHTGQLATQLLTDDSQVTMQMGANGEVITQVAQVLPKEERPIRPAIKEKAFNEVAIEASQGRVLEHMPVHFVAPEAQVQVVGEAVGDEIEAMPAEVMEAEQTDPTLLSLIGAALIPQPQPLAQSETSNVQADLTIAVPTAIPDAPHDQGDDMKQKKDGFDPSTLAGYAPEDDDIPSLIDRKQMEEVVQRVLANRADADASPKAQSFHEALAANLQNASRPEAVAEKMVLQHEVAEVTPSTSTASGTPASSVGLTVSGQERASNVLTLKASSFAAHERATPADQVKVGIKQAIRAGVDRVMITLEPEELGRVEVKIDIHKNGANHIVFTADNRFALDAIQRDAKQLEQALHNSGLGTESNTMEFNLSQRRESQDERNEQAAYGRLGTADEHDAVSATNDPMTGYYTVTVSEGLDIKV